MIKLIVTDVDGTLLDNKSQVTELNKKALLECKSKNIGVILATGKSISAVLPIIKMLDLSLPQITLNGTVTLDKNQEVLSFTKIGEQYFYEVLSAIKEKGHKPLIALTDGRILYDSFNSVFAVFEKINEPIYEVDRLEKDIYAHDCVSLSVAIKEDDPLDDYLRERFSEKLQLIRSGEYFFDILSLDASKGNALECIAAMLKIKKDEIAVFGDSPNDLSMFGVAGLKIAVRNSYPEVLKSADYITDENYNSGLGKAIYKYILS
jgi:Cof subfamily protein (haloacid dehalogenase superfamily)